MRIRWKVPGEGLGGFGAEPGQVQQGSGEGSEKVPGSVGAKPSQLWFGDDVGG